MGEDVGISEDGGLEAHQVLQRLAMLSKFKLRLPFVQGGVVTPDQGMPRVGRYPPHQRALLVAEVE